MTSATAAGVACQRLHSVVNICSMLWLLLWPDKQVAHDKQAVTYQLYVLRRRHTATIACSNTNTITEYRRKRYTTTEPSQLKPGMLGKLMATARFTLRHASRCGMSRKRVREREGGLGLGGQVRRGRRKEGGKGGGGSEERTGRREGEAGSGIGRGGDRGEGKRSRERGRRGRGGGNQASLS